MGIIKATIMTGGMTYAVNKLTKSIEQHSSSSKYPSSSRSPPINSQNQQYTQSYPPQNYARELPPPHHQQQQQERQGQEQQYNDIDSWRHNTAPQDRNEYGSERSYSPPPKYTPRDTSFRPGDMDTVREEKPVYATPTQDYPLARGEYTVQRYTPSMSRTVGGEWERRGNSSSKLEYLVGGAMSLVDGSRGGGLVGTSKRSGRSKGGSSRSGYKKKSKSRNVGRV